MATATLQITASGTTVGRVKTVSGADLVRFLAAWRAKFGTPELADAQVIELWADMTIAEAKRVIHVYEEASAVATARAGITDIAFS